MEHFQLEKAWQGKATAKLSHTTADAAWSLLSALHRWLPSRRTCRLIDGTDSHHPRRHGKPHHWASEELLDVDADGRSYRYRVADNNMGLERYETTLRAVPLPDGEGGVRRQLEWRFESLVLNCRKG